MTLAELVGERLVIGIPGTRITPEIVRHFQELHAGGLILYRINFDSAQQLKKLIAGLEEALGRRLLVTADHEGGRVIMFRDGITVFPDNLAVGRAGNLDYARQQGEIEAKELRRLGMDVNLGPVLDVLTEAYSPNIGIRAYGRDWRQVAAMGAARIKAMQQHGLSACAKHFPGKGHAPVDAHLGLPVIHSTWEEMAAVHLKPFAAALQAGVDLVMSSHPYYPRLDPYPNMIATFSRRIIYDYLRRELNFPGVIASDDLEMGAIKAICPIGQAGVLAAQAGHDLLLVCHDLKAQKEVYEKLLEAYKSKQLPLKELEESVARITALKSKRAQRFAGGEPAAEPAGALLAAGICRASVQVLQDEKKLLPLKPGEKRLGVIFPQFSSLDAKIMIEREVLQEQEFVRQEFEKFGLHPEILIVSIEPAEAEIHQAVHLAKNSDLTIFFCFDAHLYPSNKNLLDALQAAAPELVVDLLRDPYDADFIKTGAACVTDFGWRACQLKAAIAKMGSALFAD
ncbi:MAG: beta-N-acetylhexosaminidase [Syntrophobacterales bacterium]|jgi:beta-N-acetylhexosaminidase|nr:beta-N-acetylhexosaminidase [Syntrophobacterales bacterium]